MYLWKVRPYFYIIAIAFFTPNEILNNLLISPNTYSIFKFPSYSPPKKNTFVTGLFKPLSKRVPPTAFGECVSEVSFNWERPTFSFFSPTKKDQSNYLSCRTATFWILLCFLMVLFNFFPVSPVLLINWSRDNSLIRLNILSKNRS